MSGFNFSPFSPRPQRIDPQPGQESVWDYPRPPRLDPCDQVIEIVFNGVTLAHSRRTIRVLETSHPPSYYIPPDDVAMAYLQPHAASTFCEWKGQAAYYTVEVTHQGTTRRAEKVAWSYPNPVPHFRAIQGYLCFYPDPMDGCFVDGERVQPQAGDFYGGWITRNIVGPFKGGPGTWGW